MSLDITAYRNLIATTEESEDNLTLCENTDFPGRAEGLDLTKTYSGAEEVFEFNAGAYSGYGEWRRQLAALVDTTPEDVWNDPQPGPFVELINFADNKGVIGPIVSARLAKDFDTYERDAEAYAASRATGGWFSARYKDWQKAFHLAADNGAVEFH